MSIWCSQRSCGDINRSLEPGHTESRRGSCLAGVLVLLKGSGGRLPPCTYPSQGAQYSARHIARVRRGSCWRVYLSHAWSEGCTLALSVSCERGTVTDEHTRVYTLMLLYVASRQTCASMAGIRSRI